MSKKRKKEEYLIFEELNNEINKFYKDICKNKCLDEEQRKKYFLDLIEQLQTCLFCILELPEIKNSYLYYVLLGNFFEGLIKSILIKEIFDDFFLNYNDEKKPLKKFEYSKQRFITILKNRKLRDDQINRINEVINYVQIQRNNFVHFPLKSFDHYAVRHQIYTIILKLIEIFDLPFSKNILSKLKYEINNSKPISGANFKDVW